MSDNLPQANAERLKLVQAIVIIVTLPCMLGIGGWGMATIVANGQDIAVLKEKAKNAYSAAEAAMHIAENEKAFLRVEETLNDHEGRIRILDRHKH